MYVSAAKRIVYGIVDIDMIAGPSELLVIADDTANPKYCAADLLCEAEHDEEARVYLEDGFIFGDEGDGFVRINIACPRSILTEALERIKSAIAQL